MQTCTPFSQALSALRTKLVNAGRGSPRNPTQRLPHLVTESLLPNTRRAFHASSPKAWQELSTLPQHIPLQLKETLGNELLCLQWSQPPRNILLVKKDCAETATNALKEFAGHIKSTYSDINVLLEPSTASELEGQIPFGICSMSQDCRDHSIYHSKVDLIVTFGGDGTILHASSLFAAAARVPPILSFSMGTLGFLGEWKYSEFKRAFREAYMSGSETERKSTISDQRKDSDDSRTGWSSVRGKSMGATRGARVLVRQRLKVGLFDANGDRLNTNGGSPKDMHAMNEVLLHRVRDPHLAIVDVFVGGRFLTEAVADGMIVSTPTGSTAYSLSSGGSIIHPLVQSLLLTPICPRSLSFRPLVLPWATPITLRLSQKNRGREVEVSIDGARREHGIGVGAELRVSGEDIMQDNGSWHGGIPCIMRRSHAGPDSDDGWVGGLNGLLKFNHAFGEETG